jgi:hypothetical protein
MIRYYASQSLIQQDAILKGLHAVQGKTQSTGSAINNSTDPSDRLGTSVLNYVTSKLNHGEQARERRLLQTDIIHAIHKASASHLEIGSSPVDISVSEEPRKWSLGVLLTSLRYSGMKDREGRVSEAHQSTFRWLFKDNNNDKWTNYKDWLESDSKLYWITGKAGSGKSTLMKYICYPVESMEGLDPAPRCREYLTKWSGDKHLVIASFYFWNSGIQMQMTQRGLLTSLLHKILEQCPELAPLACPNRWETLCLFGDDPQDWEEQELRDALRRAMRNVSQLDATVALFVDGLDEFHGKPEELISLFQDILNFPNVKICVASRPWVEFQDAFKHKPSLMLEYLTYDDIKSFVTSRFHSEPVFVQLRRREEEFADQLIEDIVSKAAGVFLWVALVVSSLLAGMSFGDRVSDLKRRLDLLPPDLSKLYEKMLLSLDQFYLEHAAQLFSLVGASSVPMNLVLASFADEDDPDFALRREIRPLSRDEIVLRMDTMRRRINSRSKGLLEVKGLVSTPEGVGYDPWNRKQCTVQYLHRTVKDYIENDDVQKTLQSAMRPTFDPHLGLLAGHLAYIKGLNLNEISAADLWVNHFNEFLQSARAVLPSSIPKMILLLDEMDEAGSIIFQALGASRGIKPKSGLWAFWVSSSRELNRKNSPSGFDHAYLSLAVIFGIVEYVRVKAGLGCLIQRPTFGSSADDMPRYVKWSLLMDAITLGTSRMSPGSDRDLVLPMIQCLLDKGADPNYMVVKPRGMQETSPLIESVSQLMLSVDGSMQHHSWVEVTRLFARAGRIDNDTVDRAIRTFLAAEDLIWPKFRLGIFMQWNGVNSARNSLSKVLQELARGENPDLSAPVAKIESLAKSLQTM